MCLFAETLGMPAAAGLQKIGDAAEYRQQRR
jgi:hypothetical protein